MPNNWPDLLQAALIKGAIMSTMLRLLDISFWQQLIIAVVSATLTGGFLLWQEYRTERREEQAREDRESIKRGLGLDKRKEDHANHSS